MTEQLPFQEGVQHEIERDEVDTDDRNTSGDLLRNPKGRFLVFHDRRVLLEEGHLIRPLLLSACDLAAAGIDVREAIVLRNDSKAAIGAIDLGDAPESPSFQRGVFRDLHGIDDPIDPDAWWLLSKAKVLLAWNRSDVLCPTCGGPTEAQDGGAYRICRSESCGRILYPRTEPTVIVRVMSGEKCLLARKAQFSPNVRSMIAGFVEPGETLEEAVRREVKEEVDLDVDRIRYLGSQPWPFPACLMIAFEAHALGEAIRVDHEELETAAWYTREQVQQELRAGILRLSSKKSIARRMVDAWLNGAPGGRLDDGGAPGTAG